MSLSISTNVSLVILGFLPSIVWLSLFLTKDPRPEPKYLIIKVFLFGIIIAPVVVLIEAIISGVASEISFLPRAMIFFSLAAFVEEYMKYWVVRNSVVSKPDFDEPHDSIIYMIAAALGFAAMENILIAFKIYPEGFTATLGVIALRFTGATLLHALASGIVGYFLGLAWFFYHFKKQIIVLGLTIASLLHLVFNYLIFLNPAVALPSNTILLLGMLVSLLILFDKLKDRHQQVIQRVSTKIY
ncbi:MAG: Protease prsW [Parcubacteria group bacterium Gr01-1014_2]|nr:MAG: Protease prsW [Parcubacteria group bacterium Gr01-1014_2]